MTPEEATILAAVIVLSGIMAGVAVIIGVILYKNG